MQNGIQIDIRFDPRSLRTFQKIKTDIHADSDSEVGRRAILASQFFTPDTPSKEMAGQQAVGVTPFTANQVVTFYLSKEVYDIMENERKGGEVEIPAEVYLIDALRCLGAAIRKQEKVLRKIRTDEPPTNDEIVAMFLAT